MYIDVVVAVGLDLGRVAIVWVMLNISAEAPCLPTALAITRSLSSSLGNNMLKFDCMIFTGLSTTSLMSSLTVNTTSWQSTTSSDFARWHLALKLFSLEYIAKFCKYLTSAIIWEVMQIQLLYFKEHHFYVHYISMCFHTYMHVAMYCIYM